MIANSSIFNRFLLILFGIVCSLALLNPIGASAQKTEELCTGANLSFSGNKDCSKDDKGNKCKDDQGKDIPCGEQSVNNLVTTIVNIFSVVVGIVAVIMIIYAGFRFITSGGDSGAVTSARNTILYAIVGLVIVAFAQFIVKFVLNKIS